MRVKLLKLELQDGSKVKATADIQLGSLLVIRGVKLVRVDSGRLVVYIPQQRCCWIWRGKPSRHMGR